jgi:hypothetical protein
MPKCPGTYGRRLDSNMASCPACGREIEIFSEEEWIVCRCGRTVSREEAQEIGD